MIPFGQPVYYDIAFQYRPIAKECDFIEKCFDYAGKVSSVLDIGCGTGQHAIELAHRGYAVVGLDLSKEMIEAAKAKAAKAGVSAQFVIGNMLNFRLKTKFDAALCLSNTFPFLLTNEQILQHLSCVAACLRKSGIYFAELLSPKDLFKEKVTLDEWTEERDGISVRIKFEDSAFDFREQVLRSRLTLDVNDRGKKQKFEYPLAFRLLLPQELKALLKLSRRFRLIEIFGDYSGNSFERGWRALALLQRL